MDFSYTGPLIAVVIFLIWIWNSLYIIKEWERGVVLRLGRMIPDPKPARVALQVTGLIGGAKIEISAIAVKR